MRKYTDKNGNTVYAHRHPAELNIHIDFKHAKGCVVYLARGAVSLGCSRVLVYGDNAALFIGDSELGNTTLILNENSCAYIGKRSHLNPYARPQLIRTVVNQVFFMGDDNLISENLEISTSDQHPLYDAESLEQVNKNQSIYIGDHVWVGRNCTLLKNSRMASGSVLGIQSVLAGKYVPVNTVCAGVPARPLKEHRFLKNISIFNCPQAFIDAQATLMPDDPAIKQGIFEHDSSVVIRPCDIDYTLKSLKSASEKIAFLYDTFYIKAEHNRFAWNEEEAYATDGRHIPYQDSFSQHISQEGVKLQRLTSFPGQIIYDPKGFELWALYNRRYSIFLKYWYCVFMRTISRGRRKLKYKEKKAHYRYLLSRIKAMKMTIDAISR